MIKGELLQGRGTGAPLFLAWVIGLLVTYALFAVLEKLGLYRQRWTMTWSGVTACFLAFSFWQATLLLPTWPRKLLWMAAFFVSAAPLLYYRIRLPYWYDPVRAAPLLQMFLLIGVRRRVWLWLLATVAPWAIGTLPSSRMAYDWFAKLLQPYAPISFLSDSFDAYQMVCLSILGAVAAFLMPPVERRPSFSHR